MEPIRYFIQQHAEAIAEVLEIDVTIIDENCIRIGGTGPHKARIGHPVPHGSFFREILASGNPTLLDHCSRKDVCHGCDQQSSCRETIVLGYPITYANKTVGVIGVISFDAEHEKKITQNLNKMWGFLERMSTLIESMLSLKCDNERLYKQVQESLSQASGKDAFAAIIGSSPQFLSEVHRMRQVAASACTVLIRGESGTGKELCARAIHDASPRSNQPFIIVNCPSIPETLFESELFGYASGAFTGASREGYIGKFEQANKGTIFLDEVGDIPLSVQPKLLRVLQEKTVDKLNSNRCVPVDVRVIAATNKNLEEMVSRGLFRSDLYYRLNVIPISIPSLRERPSDIELYTRHFLTKWCFTLGRDKLQVDSRLLKWMVQFDWPGNVRQLENVVEYMVNMAAHSVLTLYDLPPNLTALAVAAGDVQGLAERLEGYEKKILESMLSNPALKEDKKKMADILKISLATLYRKLERYQVNN